MEADLRKDALKAQRDYHVRSVELIEIMKKYYELKTFDLQVKHNMVEVVASDDRVDNDLSG